MSSRARAHTGFISLTNWLLRCLIGGVGANFRSILDDHSDFACSDQTREVSSYLAGNNCDFHNSSSLFEELSPQTTFLAAQTCRIRTNVSVSELFATLKMSKF